MKIKFQLGITSLTLAVLLFSCNEGEEITESSTEIKPREYVEEDTVQSIDTEEVDESPSEESFASRYGTGIIVFDHTDLAGLNLFPKSDVDEDPFILYPAYILTYQEGDSDLGFIDWEFFSFYPEYDLMHAVCVEKHPDFNMNEVYFDQKMNYGIYDSIGTFYSWEQYFLEFALSVEPINDDGLYEGEIRDAPSEDGNAITSQEDYGVAWVPLSLRGDWMEIEVYEGPCQEGVVTKTGWIQWRDHEKLLISIAYVC